MKESNIIFGLMASLAREEYSYKALLHLARPFDITESCLRTTLSRMKAKNVLAIRKDGKNAFYSFSREGAAYRSHIGMTLNPGTCKDWDQSWWGVAFSVPDIKKKIRYSVRTRLITYRFASLYAGFWIRPYIKTENIEQQFDSDYLIQHCKIFRFNPAYPITKNEASDIWKLEEINGGFLKGLDLVEKEINKINNLSPHQALKKELLTGDALVNILSRDPLLPDELLPGDWKANELKTALGDYMKKVRKISRLFTEQVY